MPSVLAIVSKAVFEKMVPKNVKLGTVVETDRYLSNNKAFEKLEKGDAIFLVTVRPPDEKLWLVGILESPKRDGTAWVAQPNVTPLTDIASAIPELEFQSGTGLAPKPGALGMSLQTPRALTDSDVKLLRSLGTGTVAAAKPMNPVAIAAGAEFPDHLRELAKRADPWVHSVLPVEQGLELWVAELASIGREAMCRAAAAAGRYAYPIAMERGGEMAIESNFHEDAPSQDGEPTGRQIRRVEEWLAAPSNETLTAVEKSIDPSRQLDVWCEDLYPAPDDMWFWFLEVGQLAAFAVTHPEEGDKPDEEDMSYDWPAAVCASRAVVCALKTIRTPTGDVDEDVRAIGRAIARAFEAS